MGINGNILTSFRPVFPSIDQMLSEVKSMKCTGLLIDGDYSVRLDPHHMPHIGRSVS